MSSIDADEAQHGLKRCYAKLLVVNHHDSFLLPRENLQVLFLNSFNLLKHIILLLAHIAPRHLQLLKGWYCSNLLNPWLIQINWTRSRNSILVLLIDFSLLSLTILIELKGKEKSRPPLILGLKVNTSIKPRDYHLTNNESQANTFSINLLINILKRTKKLKQLTLILGLYSQAWIHYIHYQFVKWVGFWKFLDDDNNLSLSVCELDCIGVQVQQDLLEPLLICFHDSHRWDWMVPADIPLLYHDVFHFHFVL